MPGFLFLLFPVKIGNRFYIAADAVNVQGIMECLMLPALCEDLFVC